MPKDDWQKAKLRATYGPVRFTPKSKKSKGGAKAKQARAAQRNKKRNGKVPTKLALERLQSPDTTLWFGKFKGRQLKEIPTEYLKWLANSIEPKSGQWRIKALLDYLKAQLAKGWPTPSTKAKAQ